MQKSILLCDLNGSRQEISTVGGDYEHLGLGCLGAIAQQCDWKVTLIHQRQRQYATADIAKLAGKHDVAGFSVLAYNYSDVKACLERIKCLNPATITIVGGDLPSSVPELFNHDSVNLAVIGEGEETLREILRRIAAGQSLEDIRGTARRTGDRLEIAPPRERIVNLDALPFAMRDPIVMRASRICGVWTKSIADQVCATVSFSRGCKRRCVFCSSRLVWGQKVFWHSPRYLCNEIAHLHDMGVNSLSYNDLTFNRDPERVVNLCRSITDHDPQEIHWWAMIDPTLPNQPPEMWQRMHDAGCHKVGVGIEDPLFVQRLGKNGGMDTIASTIHAINSSGVMVRAYFMVGHPDQTSTNFQAMKEVMDQLPIGEIRISFYTPVPGTAAYKMAMSGGLLLTTDLSLFDTDHPVVKTTYDPTEVRRDLARHFYSHSPTYQRQKRHFLATGFDPSTYDYLEDRLRQAGYVD